MECNHCHQQFDHEPKEFTLNGITFQFCSETCVAAFKEIRKVS